MKTIKEVSSKLKDFSDEELIKELNIRKKKRRGKVLGYRAICYGDEYNYGGYSDYLIGGTRDLLKGGYVNMTKWQAKELAEKCVAESDNGGYIEVLYKDNINFYKGKKIN